MPAVGQSLSVEFQQGFEPPIDMSVAESLPKCDSSVSFALGQDEVRTQHSNK